MTDPAAAAAVSQPPTHVRHYVVLVTMLMSVLLYFHRFCISFAERLIKEDLGLTNEQIAWILSAFFWTYAIAQVPSGWFSDRFGARTMLTLYILLWSGFTGLIGLATGFAMLIVLRLGFGLAQAGAYPTAGGVISVWVPPTSRGKASGVVASGGRLGGILAPLVTAMLIKTFVPLDVSSLLETGDLLNVRLLAQQLNAPPPKLAPVSKLVEARLPSDARQSLEALSAESTESAAAPTAEDLTRIVAGLNAAIVDRSFYQADVFQRFDLSREALELSRRDPATLSTEEVERRNRLLLEAAYPEAIRKVYVAGWRPLFVVYGLVGLLVAGLFWFVVRDRPAQHPRCNAAEVALIEAGRGPSSATASGVPLLRLLGSGSMWLTSISQAGTNIGWVFLVTWLPRYLDEVHRVPVEKRSLMVALPLVAGWIGMQYGGRMTDQMIKTWGLRWGRALPMGLSRFACMAGFLLCLLPISEWAGPEWSPWLFTAAFSLVAFFTDLGVPAVWAFCQDVGGKRVGSILGWGNMWGNFGAAISPPLLNWAIKQHGNWDLAFLICAVSFLVSGVAALGVDATKPIVPEDAERAA